MASERSGVTSIVQNEFPLTYYFHCAMYCLNLSAFAAVKVSAIQNVDNVARKVVTLFKTSAKKTALWKSCIKEDVSGQRETKRYLVGGAVASLNILRGLKNQPKVFLILYLYCNPSQNRSISVK